MTFLVTQAALEKEKNLSKEGATPTTQKVKEKVLVKEKFIFKKKKKKKKDNRVNQNENFEKSKTHLKQLSLQQMI